MDKRNINAIIVFIFCISLLFCAQELPENVIEVSNATTEMEVISNTKETNIITFVDPVIEAATREELEQPTGDITKAQVSEITFLYINGADSNGLYGYEKIETLEDLKWFENLKHLRLLNCNIDNLNGIQELITLMSLDIQHNQIEDITPISELSNLTRLKCSDNPIKDYSPIGKLSKLDQLSLNNNDLQSVDLSFLKNLEVLRGLDLSNCNISDLSFLENCPYLMFLYLDNNQITDISILANLERLSTISINSNQIADISSLTSLKSLGIIELGDNLILREDIINWYYPVEENRIVTTFHGSICDAIPEFTFEIHSYPKFDAYEIYQINISNSEMSQTIFISEFVSITDIKIPENMRDNMGFVLEDVNFDGYLDIQLYDWGKDFGERWIYFVWNPESYCFEHDARLTDINLPTFDKEKQLIYGERHLDFDHIYNTYQYIDGEIVHIMTTEIYYFFPSVEQIETYLSLALIETYDTNYCFVSERINKYDVFTEEWSVVSDDFIIYSADEQYELVRIKATSELGQLIENNIYSTEY